MRDNRTTVDGGTQVYLYIVILPIIHSMSDIYYIQSRNTMKAIKFSEKFMYD